MYAKIIHKTVTYYKIDQRKSSFPIYDQIPKKNGAIASVSFGAERKFAFKHKETKEKIDIFLEHGSLLVMKDTTQSHWLHPLPPTKKVNTP